MMNTLKTRICGELRKEMVIRQSICPSSSPKQLSIGQLVPRRKPIHTGMQCSTSIWEMKVWY